MKVTLTNEIEIRGRSRSLDDKLEKTARYYQDALAYVIPRLHESWNVIQQYSTQQDKQSAAGRLFHATDTNPHPKYGEFDEKYNRMPAYVRRSLMSDAIGIIQSWLSNLEDWEALPEEERGNPPRLSVHHAKAPTFYRENMWRDEINTELFTTQLKLYDGKEWVWETIALKRSDAKYIHYKSKIGKLNCPTFTKHGKKTFLKFPITYSNPLCDPDEDKRVCAVDLNVNTDAVCVIMEDSGTVVARRFITARAEKARWLKCFNRVRKAQSKHGARSCRRLWRRANAANEDIVRAVARQIVDFAVEYSCSSLVFEFLDFKGKIRGSKKYRCALWRKRGVYHRCYDQAHVWGMRVHQVCAWNTSRLAFDGSGRVKRGGEICDESGVSLGLGYSCVRFSTGKLYSADLNAALNIGARYFLRSCLKSLPVTVASVARANVLGGLGGSAWTLSSLIDLRAWLGGRKSAWASCPVAQFCTAALGEGESDSAGVVSGESGVATA